MTTYRRMLQLATLQPRDRKSLKLDPSVQQLHQLGPPCVIQGVPLSNCTVTVVLRSHLEAEVYSWIPAALVDRLDESKEVKNLGAQRALHSLVVGRVMRLNGVRTQGTS
eukprot:g11494.t1